MNTPTPLRGLLGAKLRVLLVDDQESILCAMEDYFVACGARVWRARESAEAEALLAALPFDLMVADLRLGGINDNEGLELISFVRERNLPIRVVLLTAFGSPETEREARTRGVDLFVQKPFPLRRLAELAFAAVGEQS
ncbi:MAG: response regulator [Gemmatimonadales bacterium]